MVSLCLPSDALLQHLPSSWVSLTLDEGYLLTAAPPDLECGVAPLGPPAPAQPFFIIGDWNAKVGSQDIPEITGKFGPGEQNEAGHIV